MIAEAAEIAANHDTYMLPWWLVSILGGGLVAALIYRSWEIRVLVKSLNDANTQHRTDMKAQTDILTGLVRDSAISNGNIVHAVDSLRQSVDRMGD